MRHLALPFAIGALRRGREIEQFLGPVDGAGERGIRWVSIGSGAAGFTVSLFERADLDGSTLRDLPVLPSLSEQHTESSDERRDAAELDGRAVGTASSAEGALALAERALGTHPERWVNSGVVGNEYDDYLQAGRRWPPA
ncbi:hypothetical protein [Pseudonocardia sp. TRM90224]|uniref:hypothetical protein n=1 Tax=Pseudonocardia sp. TRM90224 TaxID=2812678 RepID=UPI001E3BB82D|nr:hypothetical protein [Pseudonocardia sp. TRM90224]